jgi:glycosyltransferase involved in cell wall biosynthesis
MRIGIEGACLSNRRGFGRVARQLVAGLSRANSAYKFVVLVDRPSVESVEIPASFETVAVEVKEAPSKAAAASGRRSVGDMLAMSRAIAKSSLDLIYFPASYSFVPVWGVKRVVVTLHDTLPLAHPELVFPDGKGRLAWRAKERAAVAWSDMIIAPSESAKYDLVNWYRLADDRIQAIHWGPDAAFEPKMGDEGLDILRRYGVDPSRRFWLYVGGLSPNKNLLRLIEAFSHLGPDERLVLVGDFGDVFLTHVPELRTAVERYQLADRVHFTGFVPDSDLAYLYTRAYALVQPSLMEGFGLPPVEAMACGTPIASSTAGSLPEVVGDAGVFFDPRDILAMAASMALLRDNPQLRDSLAQAALARSHKFTWDRAAGSLLQCFDDLLGNKSRKAPLGKSA